MNKTDNEIIKALECCISGEECDCLLCPLHDEEFCTDERNRAELDLINRQKAEIERLQEHNNILICRVDDIVYECDCAKQEAIKEFAERLKEEPIKCAFPLLGLQTRDEIEEYFNDIMLQVRDAIDKIVKEMNAQKQNEDKWIEHYSFDVWHYDCPFCDDGYATKGRDTTPPNFCSNCGAKLSGVKCEENNDD